MIRVKTERASRPEILHRPLRYLLAGGFNTLVSYGTYALTLAAGLSLPLASLAGLLVGIAVGYTTQGRFVFLYRTQGALRRYLLNWAAMYAVHLGIVSGLLLLEVNAFAGGLVALAVITMVSYFVQRDFVFRADQTKTR